MILRYALCSMMLLAICLPAALGQVPGRPPEQGGITVEGQRPEPSPLPAPATAARPEATPAQPTTDPPAPGPESLTQSAAPVQNDAKKPLQVEATQGQPTQELARSSEIQALLVSIIASITILLIGTSAYLFVKVRSCDQTLSHHIKYHPQPPQQPQQPEQPRHHEHPSHGEAVRKLEKSINDVQKYQEERFNSLTNRLDALTSRLQAFAAQDFVTSNIKRLDHKIEVLQSDVSQQKDHIHADLIQMNDALKEKMAELEKTLAMAAEHAKTALDSFIRSSKEKVRPCLEFNEKWLQDVLGASAQSDLYNKCLKTVNVLISDIAATDAPECHAALPSIRRFRESLASCPRVRLQQALSLAIQNRELQQRLQAISGEPSTAKSQAARILSNEAEVLQKELRALETSPLDAPAVWAEIEKDLLDALDPYFVHKYDAGGQIEPTDFVARHLRTLDIEPLAIRLNMTIYKPENCISDGSRNAGTGASPGAIIQVTAQGYRRPSTEQCIRKARVITQSET